MSIIVYRISVVLRALGVPGPLGTNLALFWLRWALSWTHKRERAIGPHFHSILLRREPLLTNGVSL